MEQNELLFGYANDILALCNQARILDRAEVLECGNMALKLGNKELALGLYVAILQHRLWGQSLAGV